MSGSRNSRRGCGLRVRSDEWTTGHGSKRAIMRSSISRGKNETDGAIYIPKASKFIYLVADPVMC